METEDKVLDSNLTLKRKRIMIYFIEATEKLIRQDSGTVHTVPLSLYPNFFDLYVSFSFVAVFMDAQTVLGLSLSGFLWCLYGLKYC